MNSRSVRFWLHIRFNRHCIYQGNFSAVLDVLDEFHSMLKKGEVAGLAAFRHLDTEVCSMAPADWACHVQFKWQVLVLICSFCVP